MPKQFVKVEIRTTDHKKRCSKRCSAYFDLNNWWCIRFRKTLQGAGLHKHAIRCDACLKVEVK